MDFCVRFLDALGVSGAGVTEDVEATATSGPDEAIRAGGVMEGLPPVASSMALYHFQDAAVASTSSVLTPVAGHIFFTKAAVTLSCRPCSITKALHTSQESEKCCNISV